MQSKLISHVVRHFSIPKLLAFSFLCFAHFSTYAEPDSPSSYAEGFIHTKAHQQCTSCHQSQHDKWLESDHFKAMDLATEKTVLGDFKTTTEHYDHKAKFWRKDDQFMATFTEKGKETTYKIDYVFGYYPLQQYLTHIKDGHYQVLPFSWDTRTPEEGGQNWFHMYPDEGIAPNDRLHWQTPIQNWNGMCADCHSDRLVRNYDIKANSFDTTWTNINVGCLSCHGEITEQTPEQIKNRKVNAGYWAIVGNNTTAQWHGEPRDNSFMDNCYACHSLRAPLTDGFKHDEGFLNQFSPMFLQSPLYYADGHILDEVYVWGSFQQSKKFAAGVNCLDCHDSHTYKVKTQTNGLCLQCHDGTVYDVEQHHKHKLDSTGAQCANCHMPHSTYMVRDDRRDHSFRIPRPQNSLKYGTPNACTKCHEDQTDEWAANWTRQWYGEQPESQGAIDYMRLQVGEPLDAAAILRLAADTSLPPIKRASSLRLIPRMLQGGVSPGQLEVFVKSEEPLLRIAAAEASLIIDIRRRGKLIQPLLRDPLRAVRVAAANALVDASVDKDFNTDFEKAYAETVRANEVSSWRGEGHANQALLHMRKGEAELAEDRYLTAIFIDPYFPDAYVNLTNIYHVTAQPEKAAKYFELGIENNPKNGTLKYAYGLHFIRQGQPKQALAQMDQAVRLEPQNEVFIYAWLLTLDSVGQSDVALSRLLRLRGSMTLSGRLNQLGMSLAQKLGNANAYKLFSEGLLTR